MKASYQRELYRSRMCCELERTESDYGYPLQMCLRNSIPGLLPCSAEPLDGHIYICWDITSRNSLKELSGEGFTRELLERVLRAVYEVMRELDGYLVSSGYLVLLPEQIYLDASRKRVEFVCDFEDETGFRTGIQKLAEYILAGIDHRDSEQMRLGYGLYRLAVQENFPREDFQSLLFGREKQEKKGFFAEKDLGLENRTGRKSAGDLKPEETGGSGVLPEDTAVGDMERQKILDSFFEDDEEDKRGAGEYLPLYALLAAVAVCGLEVFFYLRNGRHIHPGWLVFGLLLTAVCAGAVCVAEYIRNRGKGIGKTQLKQKSSRENVTDNVGRDEVSVNMEPDGGALTPLREAVPYGNSGETMVLQSPWQLAEKEVLAVLEPVEQDGGQFTIPGKGAVLGKLPEAADIILPSPAVSRIHARITRKGEDYFVQDLNSRNGTCVNGQPLASQQFVQLKEQDEVRFADLSYRFRLKSKG